jgi:hypothetical protein
MEWNQDLIRLLREKLAYLIPNERDARTILEDAGIDPAMVDLSGSPMSRWASALSETQKLRRLDQLLQLASDQYSSDDLLLAMRNGQLVVQPQPSINWHGPNRLNLERLTSSENTLVPISFLERGLQIARSVARIRISGIGFGTGFLISEDLILTNNHVLKDAAQASGAFADFKYERQLNGSLQPEISLELDPNRCFFTSLQHDWTVVGVKGSP